MNLDKKIANAVGGKTARACDCCLTKRARWYCSADDAFLCQSCDSSVHSANALARRHDRVQLKTASFKPPLHNHGPVHLPTWQRGPIKKTRTPRHGKNIDPNLNNHNSNPILTVPELGVDETNMLSHEEEGEDNLMYRVPVSEEKYEPLDLEMEEFVVDVESLLGKELDEERYGMEKLGFFVDDDGKDDITPIDFFKDEDEIMVNGENDDLTIRESFDFCFDYDNDHGGGQDFPTTYEDQKVKLIDDNNDSCQSFLNIGQKIEILNTLNEHKVGDNKDEKYDDERVNKSNEMIMKLRLDYEAICEAWGSQGSPWMNGQRPQINHEDYWSHCMRGTSAAEMCVPSIYVKQHQRGVMEGNSVAMMSDGGREARVSRYREKRRTRLFAKKIRYEVRKLNAEKRPRMKGRFVKRSSFASTTTFSLASK